MLPDATDPPPLGVQLVALRGCRRPGRAEPSRARGGSGSATARILPRWQGPVAAYSIRRHTPQPLFSSLSAGENEIILSPPPPLSTHERKLNKTKQMAARRTAQRRRTRCPLPSRSRLVLNEVSRVFFFLFHYFFSSSCVHTVTQTHGVRISPGFFVSPDIKTVVSLSLLCC